MMSWLSAAWDWYAAHSDKVNPIAAGLGGVALVWAAVRQARTATNRHYEQTRADQQRRLTESFSKAVEQLAGDKIEARLGGIYTLERLAIEAIAQVRSTPWWRRLHGDDIPPADPISDLYWTVMETLTAFVRDRAKWQPTAAAEDAALQPTPATDIAAVLTVIRRRPGAGRARERQRNWVFDLNTTDLRGADLSGVYFEGVNLCRSHLEGAGFEEAHLERANFVEAHLQNADFHEAHIEGTNFVNAAGLRIAHFGMPFAYGDAHTLLPHDVSRPSTWPPYTTAFRD